MQRVKFSFSLNEIQGMQFFPYQKQTGGKKGIKRSVVGFLGPYFVEFTQCRDEVCPLTGVLKVFEGFVHCSHIVPVLWVTEQLHLLCIHSPSWLILQWTTQPTDPYITPARKDHVLVLSPPSARDTKRRGRHASLRVSLFAPQGGEKEVKVAHEPQWQHFDCWWTPTDIFLL